MNEIRYSSTPRLDHIYVLKNKIIRFTDNEIQRQHWPKTEEDTLRTFEISNR